jgi:hypothetical protein
LHVLLDDRARSACGLGDSFPGKAQLEEELGEKEKRMLRLRQVLLPRRPSSVRCSQRHGYQGRALRQRPGAGGVQDDLGAAFVFHAPRGAGKDGNTGAARIQLVAQGEGRLQELP